MNSVLRLSLLLLPLALAGSCASVCATGACRTNATLQFADMENFAVSTIEGEGFTHDVFLRSEPRARSLWIFIEGDGEPWLKDGSGIADDPTAPVPLALHLAARTQGSVAYLGRPCYLTSVHDVRCTPSTWTVDRYSNEVVASMNAAAAKIAAQTRAGRIVLVGHSGGGALAALMAQSMPQLNAIVTVAANLDTDEWNARHGYWPLSGSRNPAKEPLPAASVVQVHLVGARDTNVTPAMNARYFARIPASSVWTYDRFDHSCCWEWEWPSILRRLIAKDPALREW